MKRKREIKSYICIWYNPNKDCYYRKGYEGFGDDVYPRMTNQYGHILVFILDIGYMFEQHDLRLINDIKSRLNNNINCFLDKFY